MFDVSFYIVRATTSHSPLQVLYRGCGRLQLQDVPKKMWNVTSGIIHCWNVVLGREFARWTWWGRYGYIDQYYYRKVVGNDLQLDPSTIDECSLRRMHFYIRRTCLWMYLGDSWTNWPRGNGSYMVTTCLCNWFHHVTLTHAQCDLVWYTLR